MTDDFQLFQDAEGGDPDIALITAYLARELSLVQIVAVEDRLATDAAFLAKVLPVMEAWTLPGSLGGSRRFAAPSGPTSLTRDEIEKGWQRYVAERVEIAPESSSRPVLMNTTTPTRRRPSMTRIAAGIAAVVLPAFAIAQAAMYAAKNDDMPGHATAKRIVAPFVTEAPAPVAQVPQHLPQPVDVPVGRELTKAPESVQRVESAATVSAPSRGMAPASSAPQSVPAVKPDRAKISALALKYHPNVVRGDTTVDYVVMVLDATGNYVWSTYGSGSVAIEIAGDSRTGAERAQFVRDNRLEYTGMELRGTLSPRGAAGAGAEERPVVGAVGVLRVDSLRRHPDTTIGRVRAGGGGGAVAAGATRLDSIGSRSTLRIDSTVVPYRIATGAAVATRSPAPVGEWATALVADTVRGPYRIGFGRMMNGQSLLNEAPGLQQPGNNQSGVQGLLASSITAGEAYMFVPAQLAPGTLRIVVLHLAPGTRWNGK